MSKSVACRLLVVVVCLATVCSAAKWSYDGAHGEGPAEWHKVSASCGGRSQSPIDIQQGKARVVENLGVLSFDNYESASGLQLSNNGHTAVVTLTTQRQSHISGAGLRGRYILEQFHMHWGQHDKQGSEHTIDGKSYPLEIHLVHHSNNYTNVSHALSATRDNEALAVLGIFAQVGDKTHETLDVLIDKFRSIKYYGHATGIDSVNLMNLLPENQRRFARYSGSLTTPTCNEAVVWTVFTDPITVSATQMAAFRTLSHNKAGTHDQPLQDNFRPVQKLNQRVVSLSYTPTIPLSGSAHTVSLAAVIAGMALLALTAPLC